MMIRRRAAWPGLIIVAAVLLGCGGGTSSQLGSELAQTEWVVTDMTGFPPDNVVEGQFDFTDDRFRLNDGRNSASWPIDWDDTGFTVSADGDSTTAGYDGPYSHLAQFVATDSHVDVTVGEDGSLRLTSRDMTVVAEPAE